MDAPLYVQRMLVTAIFSITGLHQTYGCPTVSLAYVGFLYLQNHWVTLHLQMRHLKCSLFWLPLVRKSLRYALFMGAPS